jgi:hypothetical protein
MPAVGHAAGNISAQKRARAAVQPLAAQQGNGGVKRQAWLTQRSDDTDDFML